MSYFHAIKHAAGWFTEKVMKPAAPKRPEWTTLNAKRSGSLISITVRTQMPSWVNFESFRESVLVTWNAKASTGAFSPPEEKAAYDFEDWLRATFETSHKGVLVKTESEARKISWSIFTPASNEIAMEISSHLPKEVASAVSVETNFIADWKDYNLLAGANFT